jgi:hypothetical protein
VSPRPPDFNHVFAPDARHDFSSFRAGCVVTVRIAAGADLRLPAGRLVASEPGAGHDAFVQRVPPGTYPVELIVADYHDPGNPDNLLFQEVAAARLRVRDEPVASWRMALQPGQDETELEDDEYFGYPVDGGRGSFGSPELYEATEDLTEWEVFWPEIDQVDEVGVYVDEETGANLVIFSSGDGDGHYATWVGYTVAGEVACFVTDFLTLTEHADEDECEYCETSPRGPKPAAASAGGRAATAPGPEGPVRPLSGPASYAAGPLMLVGQTLRRQSLTSPSGWCTLVHQDDGNLVLYRYDRDRAVWATGTNGRSVGELAMQADGNLVLYDRDGHAVWATGTNGRRAARLSVRDEGTVVLEAVDGSELWSAPARIRAGQAGHPFSAGTERKAGTERTAGRHLSPGTLSPGAAKVMSRAATAKSPGAAMVEPYGGGTGFRFKIRNVAIDGQGDTVRVRGGGSHEVSFEVLHDCPECGNAVNQVIVGLAGQDRAQSSVWNGKQRSGGGAKVVNSGTDVAAVAEDNPGPAEWVAVSCDIVVPDGPGTYSVRARYAQAYQGRLMTAEGRAIPQPEYQDVLGWWKVDRPDGPGPGSAIGTIIVES